MAGTSQPDDFSELLREVEANLSAGDRAQRRGATPVPARPEAAGLGSRTSTALVAGAVAAALVGLLFALLPFLGAVSGAAGAFLAAAVVAFVLTRRR
jgi:hypothetical protein